MGLKSVKVTKTRYGQIKNQLEGAAQKNGKRARSPNDEDEDQEETPKATPAKAGNKNKRAKIASSPAAKATSKKGTGLKSEPVSFQSEGDRGSDSEVFYEAGDLNDEDEA